MLRRERGTDLFAGTEGGVFLSTDNGATWTATSNGLTSIFVRALIVSGQYLFAGTDVGGVFRLNDNGANWTEVNSGITDKGIWAFALSGTHLFAGTYGGGVFRSTDNGRSWTAANAGLTNMNVHTFAVSGANLFAGTIGGGVFLSTDNGTSWTTVNNGLINMEIKALAVNVTYIFAGTEGNGMWQRPLSEMFTSVEVQPTNMPAQFKLNQNYPNPFNPATTISFGLPAKSFVTLKVFDALVREVATLISRELSAGNYTQQWNAEGLPGGIYFYRLRVGDYSATKKLLFLK